MSAFFDEGMPVPAFEIDTAAFWDGCKQHTLMIQRCKRCGTYRHAPAPVCHECHSFEHEFVESQGIGEVYTYSIIQHPVHPATKAAVPYNTVVVQLLDCGGAKIVSNLIEANNDDIKIGMRVQVAWEDVTPEIALPRFRPLASRGRTTSKQT